MFITGYNYGSEHTAYPANSTVFSACFKLPLLYMTWRGDHPAA